MWRAAALWMALGGTVGGESRSCGGGGGCEEGRGIEERCLGTRHQETSIDDRSIGIGGGAVLDGSAFRVQLGDQRECDSCDLVLHTRL
jgi:hypothetical protein